MAASVHQLNEAFAAIRGVGRDNIEAYSRVLRVGGLLPATKRGSGATVPTTIHAGYIMAAVMRGSPLKATENAREVGDLIVHSGTTFQPVLDRQIVALGWPEDMSFARAIGWLIDRYVDNTIGNFVAEKSGIKVVVDRYWTTARLEWFPTPALLDAYVEGWRESFKTIENPPLPERNPDGSLHRPMEIGFHTPLLHEVKISYGVDKERNREAHRKYRALREHAGKFDVWGSETVTERTLMALAEVFK